LNSSPSSRRRRRQLLAAAVAVAALAVACGDDDTTRTQAADPAPSDGTDGQAGEGTTQDTVGDPVDAPRPSLPPGPNGAGWMHVFGKPTRANDSGKRVMYIPAEAIYYDLLINEVGSVKVNTRNLIDYAYNEKKVIIVSPTTFAAYLQSVLYGFKAFKIEETAKDIAKNVEALGRHLNAYQDYYKKLGNSLSTTVNHFNAGSKELGKIDKDVLRITGESAELETPLLEKPSLQEN